MSKATVSIPKEELQSLRRDAAKLIEVAEIMKDVLLSPPPVRQKEVILNEFKKIKRYKPKFLESLKSALERSTYFK